MSKLRDIKTFEDFLTEVAKSRGWEDFENLLDQLALDESLEVNQEAAELYAQYRAEQAIADYEKSKWKTGFPDLIEGKTYSRNVIAEVEGFTDLQIMCVFHITDDIDYMAWDKGFDGLYGDCVFDDNYNVIRWTEIPTTPKP